MRVRATNQDYVNTLTWCKQMALVSLQSSAGRQRLGKIPGPTELAMRPWQKLEPISVMEQELVRAAKAGDRDAQERLLEPFRTKLVRFFVTRVRDADEAAKATW